MVAGGAEVGGEVLLCASKSDVVSRTSMAREQVIGLSRVMNTSASRNPIFVEQLLGRVEGRLPKGNVRRARSPPRGRAGRGPDWMVAGTDAAGVEGFPGVRVRLSKSHVFDCRSLQFLNVFGSNSAMEFPGRVAQLAEQLTLNQ